MGLPVHSSKYSAALRHRPLHYGGLRRNRWAEGGTLYAARIEDRSSGELMKIDCGACQHTALLSPAFLSRLGLSPQAKVLDLKDQVRCRGCGVRGQAVVSIKWGKSVA
jgi:hypothetical protein